MDIDNLKKLRNDIEHLESVHQKEVFEIIKKTNIEYTKNKNGIFINMCLLKNKTLNAIVSYINYVKVQKQHLNKAENDKKMYKEKFYSKGNKEMATLEE